MPVIKRSQIGKQNTAPPQERGQVKPKLLPTQKNKPSDDLGSYSILLYGAKKIGKTTLCAEFPDALFLACEPGTDALEVYSAPVTSWGDCEAYLEQLKQSKQYKTVIVDTVDMAYQFAFDKICQKYKIKSPTEQNDYGMTWGEIKSLFRAWVLGLLSLGRGVIFVSHDKEKEVELRDGNTVEQIRPTLSNQGMEIVEALVDIIASYQYQKQERRLYVTGSQYLVGGSRLKTRFKDTSGNRLEYVPMGNSEEDGYRNFVAAFNNKLPPPQETKPTPQPLKKRKDKANA